MLSMQNVALFIIHRIYRENVLRDRLQNRLTMSHPRLIVA